MPRVRENPRRRNRRKHNRNPGGKALVQIADNLTKQKTLGNSKLRSLGTFETTAYGPPWGGINGNGEATACGVRIDGGSPSARGVAAYSNLPCGTVLYVSNSPWGGPSLVVVWDRGSAIGKNKLDFYHPDRGTQTRWGRRNVVVYDTGQRVKLPTNADDLNRVMLEATGAKAVNVGGKIKDAIGNVADTINPLDEVAEVLKAFVRFISRLFEPSFWLRVGKVVLGAVALIIGVGLLGRAMIGVDPVRKGTRAVSRQRAARQRERAAEEREQRSIEASAERAKRTQEAREEAKSEGERKRKQRFFEDVNKDKPPF